MTTLAEIEAAAASLPPDQQLMLFEWLKPRIMSSTEAVKEKKRLLEIAPVSLGRMSDLLPESGELFDEMLEGRT
jgi:hypothetical protein